MISLIKNEFLTLKVESKGAEMISLKDNMDSTEYIWQGDPSVWNRHAPILFPIVGKLKDNKYKIDGTVYEMSQHGFARDMEFNLTEQKDNRIKYELKSDEETLKKYPYKFKLTVEYILNKNKVDVVYSVDNVDKKTIWFSIGGHPGFRCPMFEGERYEDYYLKFEYKDTAYRYFADEGLVSDRKALCFNNEYKLFLSRDIFNEDAFIFKNLKSKKVVLKSVNKRREIEFDFNGFPYLGIWSKPDKEANFVCIEPWCGIADNKETDGNFKNKEGIISLNQDAKFNCKYSIKVNRY